MGRYQEGHVGTLGIYVQKQKRPSNKGHLHFTLLQLGGYKSQVKVQKRQ
jgi:hypothetical protein